MKNKVLGYHYKSEEKKTIFKENSINIDNSSEFKWFKNRLKMQVIIYFVKSFTKLHSDIVKLLTIGYTHLWILCEQLI